MIKDKHTATPILPGEQVAFIEEFEGGRIPTLQMELSDRQQ
jgi:hypothetical protein